ncbi:hypothetical protein [Rhodococcus sp. X156]|uniref:phage shock envelope stress response protein PspM n=1 Tax=Rhodococcus sp. X156 TaxID=2499145 RepID=UPI000FD7B166|nr:hypothetical protein [Rhodococcus sp. X156]
MSSPRFDLSTAFASAQEAARGVGNAVTRWQDPRRRALRKRRAATASTVGFGSATGAFTAGTAGLAVFDAPSLVVAAGCGLAAAAAVPTTAFAVRLRRLRRLPLPPGRSVDPRLPRASAALAPLRGLAAAESSLHNLFGLLEADAAVPPGEVQEARASAASAAAVLRHEAGALGALERARDSSPVAATELEPVVGEAVRRLQAGVAEYEQVVAAAARAVATTSRHTDHHRPALTETAERIDALTAALDELAGLHTAERSWRAELPTREW